MITRQPTAAFGSTNSRQLDMGRSSAPRNYSYASRGADAGVPNNQGGVRRGLGGALEASRGPRPTAYEPNGGSPFVRQSLQDQQDTSYEYVRQDPSATYIKQDTSWQAGLNALDMLGSQPRRDRNVGAYALGADRQPRSYAQPAERVDDYRDAFKPKTGGGGAGSAAAAQREAKQQMNAVLSTVGSAIEQIMDSRAKSDMSRDVLPRPGQTSSYKPVEQASWARERLLGQPVGGAPIFDDPELLQQKDEAARRRAVHSLTWTAEPRPVIEVDVVDRIEQTFKQRLGIMEISMGSANRAQSYLLDDCDPTRSGRVALAPFVEEMTRKLNFDYAGTAELPSSRAVLVALFARFDLEKSGSLPQDALLAAAQGSTPGARTVRFIGRLREALLAHGGGIDGLQTAARQWAALAMAQGEGRYPRGCVPRDAFEQGLSPVLALAQLASSDAGVRAADINAVCKTFEPPSSAGTGELVSYAEFVLACRGPCMNPYRRKLVQRAYEAMRRDGKGDVRPIQLAQRFNASAHPGVKRGLLAEDEVAIAVLWPWENDLDSKVTLADFAERCEWISAYFDSDILFEDMMRAAWQLKDP